MSDNEIDQNENLMSVDSSDEDSNDSEDEESSMKGQKNEVGNLKINKKWTDRERVLLLCSRGSVARTRHLINDLKRLMPHIRSEAKYGKSKSMADDLNEMSELANCTKCLYFESRKGRDVYLWMSHIDGGPSAKFLVRNLHSMNELNMIGNCLKGSRPILSFDPKFDEKPHLNIIKNLLFNIFKTPNHHPKSQPFIDHVFNFALTVDENIWFRNYQIINEKENELQEIGPRFVLQLIRIFDGSFCGAVLYDNPEYLSPNHFRRQLKLQKAAEFNLKNQQKEEQKIKEKIIREVKLDDPIGEIFNTKSEDNKNNDDDENMEEEEVEKEEKKKKIKIKNNQELNAAKTLRRKILKGRIRKKKAKKTIKK
uniref:Ribosome biogenesis protein BRX1 homolog n=1 Tax=Meloidogyne enterolobii TaxID=390850 RepID=A0A6V7V008_MELEN|nr:unnamed protein product [Meloidogyne enterolobii]